MSPLPRSTLASSSLEAFLDPGRLLRETPLPPSVVRETGQVVGSRELHQGAHGRVHVLGGEAHVGHEPARLVAEADRQLGQGARVEEGLERRGGQPDRGQEGAQRPDREGEADQDDRHRERQRARRRDSPRRLGQQEVDYEDDQRHVGTREHDEHHLAEVAFREPEPGPPTRQQGVGAQALIYRFVVHRPALLVRTFPQFVSEAASSAFLQCPTPVHGRVPGPRPPRKKASRNPTMPGTSSDGDLLMRGSARHALPPSRGRVPRQSYSGTVLVRTSAGFGGGVPEVGACGRRHSLEFGGARGWARWVGTITAHPSSSGRATALERHGGRRGTRGSGHKLHVSLRRRCREPSCGASSEVRSGSWVWCYR